MAADLGDKISQTHTLEEFISRRFDDQITFRNLAIIENVNGEEWIDRTLILDYLPELKNISQDVELTSEEYRKYKCNPDLLAYDIYGSTQLDFIILLINDIIDAKEFDSKKLKIAVVSSEDADDGTRDRQRRNDATRVDTTGVMKDEKRD